MVPLDLKIYIHIYAKTTLKNWEPARSINERFYLNKYKSAKMSYWGIFIFETFIRILWGGGYGDTISRETFKTTKDKGSLLHLG